MNAFRDFRVLTWLAVVTGLLGFLAYAFVQGGQTGSATSFVRADKSAALPVAAQLYQEAGAGLGAGVNPAHVKDWLAGVGTLADEGAKLRSSEAGKDDPLTKSFVAVADAASDAQAHLVENPGSDPAAARRAALTAIYTLYSLAFGPGGPGPESGPYYEPLPEDAPVAQTPQQPELETKP